MADEEAEQTEPTPTRKPNGFFTRRRVLTAGVVIALALILVSVLTVVLYKGGTFDTYIRDRFRERMAEMGIVFNAEVFRVTVSPLALELHNATFNDRVSGEKLFFIRDAHLAMTVQDL